MVTAVTDSHKNARVLALPSPLVIELQYASNLFAQAERTLSGELAVLAAAGIHLDTNAQLKLSALLSRLSAAASLRLLQEKEAVK